MRNRCEIVQIALISTIRLLWCHLNRFAMRLLISKIIAIGITMSQNYYINKAICLFLIMCHSLRHVTNICLYSDQMLIDLMMCKRNSQMIETTLSSSSINTNSISNSRILQKSVLASIKKNTIIHKACSER